MKTRKSLEHSELVVEVQRLMAPQFKAAVREIKARIEDLITRDYLERGDGGSTVVYVM